MGADLSPEPEPRQVFAIHIHGACRLPYTYNLVVVPGDATFVDDEPDTTKGLLAPVDSAKISISSSYNFIKILVSLAQLLYAISTLYEARGDQIRRYGYAAFGLTVAPYAWMSFLNLVGNLVCPQYDSMYIVESSGLDELRQSLAALPGELAPAFGVSGTVGRLSPQSEEDLQRWYTTNYRLRDPMKEAGGVVHCMRPPRGRLLYMAYIVSTVVCAMVPIGIVGGLSGFQRGESAEYQRVWTMLWLSFGLWVGSAPSPIAASIGAMFGNTQTMHVEEFMETLQSDSWSKRLRRKESLVLRDILVFSSLATGAVGGYVIVGKMLREYGTCVNIV